MTELVQIERETLEALIDLVDAENDRLRRRRGAAVKTGVEMRSLIVARAKAALPKVERAMNLRGLS